MYSSKLSISKRFSMSFTWNILYILPCSVNLRFTTLLKNQVDWIFWALLSCRCTASCWFSWDILSLTKSLPENFRLLSSWDLLPRFLRLYFPVIGLNTRKYRPEITPYLDTFHAVSELTYKEWLFRQVVWGIHPCCYSAFDLQLN